MVFCPKKFDSCAEYTKLALINCQTMSPNSNLEHTIQTPAL